MSAPHGTYGGYQQHRLAGQQACDACLEANRQYKREYRDRRADVRAKDIAQLHARREATKILIQRHRDEFRALLTEVSA